MTTNFTDRTVNQLMESVIKGLDKDLARLLVLTSLSLDKIYIQKMFYMVNHLQNIRLATEGDLTPQEVEIIEATSKAFISFYKNENAKIFH